MDTKRTYGNVSAQVLQDLDCKRLSIWFDEDKLQGEIQSTITDDMWLFHHDTYHEHIKGGGDWYDVSLTSSTGSYKDDHSVRTAPMDKCNIITDVCRKMPYTQSIIDFFQPTTRCRLFKLKANSVIGDHVDDNLLDYGLARLIIPVFVNDQCFTIMEKVNKYTMQSGECWYMNDAKLHRIENNSDLDRVVIVIQSYDLEKVSGLLF